ncbi:MAG: AraC family transcriptional regulator [Desulfobacterales bacterium]|nr:AraC family transcriptional regulator [Desulfobacterales bacterium]MCP4163070.1 AraC family transcriptional regulator [Deltaproteobacteria bacterium]
MLKEWKKFIYIKSLGGLEVLHARFYKHSFGKHFHDGYAFGAILDGSETYFYNKNKHIAKTGSIVVVNPGEIHTGHASNVKDGWYYFMFYPTPALIKKALGDLEYPDKLPFFKESVLQDNQLFWKIVEFKRSLHISSGDLAVESCFLEIIDHFIKKYADFSYSGRDLGNVCKKMDYIREKIDSDFTENLSLEQLSHDINISPYALMRQFKKKTGISPYLYQSNLRIRNAKNLLVKGYPLVEAALESGFHDQSHLTKHFKKWIGVTPGDYIKGLA